MRLFIKHNLHRWSRKDLILLLERLELYISSGLALNKALLLAAQGISKKQAIALTRMREAVESGASLSAALVKSMRISPTIISLISHGESGGELGKVLGQARALLEREDELIKKCMSAMTYPLVIGLFAVGLSIGLMRGIMPQIIPMLNGLHVKLPLLTRIVMKISQGFLLYGTYGFILGISLMAVTFACYKKFHSVRRAFQISLMAFPLIGKLFISYYCSLTMRSMGSLIESGISLKESYSDVTQSLSFLPLRDSFLRFNLRVSEGLSLGTIMSSIKRLPAFISPLISAGEASGTLGSSLIRAATIVDRDLEHSLKKLTSLIEPVMMAGMGCGVGAIAVSIMMPIYDISKALQH